LHKTLGLEKNVHFLNEVRDASGLIPQFDFSLITSQSEGLPQVIFESFYHKVPVVSTNVGGIPEVIEDGVNGMLTNPHEPQSLADKLIALSRDKDLCEKFKQRSYRTLIENFSSRKMAEQTLAEYKKVLYGKNSTGS
jgi:glycosyltransferase involved in cell wall biosynthesis